MTVRHRGGAAVLIAWLLLMVAIGRAPGQTLRANLSLDTPGDSLWSYTVTNLEPQGSPNWVTAVFLPVGAPIHDIKAPSTWSVDSDGLTYVLWQNIEPPPYADDLPPGESLSGFEFQSTVESQMVDFSIASWDHDVSQPGPEVSGLVLSPFAPATVPEPNEVLFMSAALLAGIGLVRRKGRQEVTPRHQSM